MAKTTSNAAAKPGLVARVRGFFQDVKMELSKVTWPTIDELKVSTQVVLVLLGLFAAVIYVYDMVFLRVVTLLLEVV
jgi:preprotein translocase subunit SecE